MKNIMNAWKIVLTAPVESNQTHNEINTSILQNMIIDRKEVEEIMYWLTGIFGLLLVFAPFMFGYSDNSVAVTTSLLIGGATVLVSWIEGTQNDSQRWEYWTVAILGIIAVVAPFTLGFSNHAIAMWTTVIGGALIAVFAGRRLSTKSS